MADDDGYLIVRNAIPKSLAQEAGDAIQDRLPVRVKQEKLWEFEAPKIAH